MIDEAEIELDEMAGKSDRELKLEVLKHTSEKMQEEAEEEEETFKEIEQMEGAPAMQNPEDQVIFCSSPFYIKVVHLPNSQNNRNIFETLPKLFQCWHRLSLKRNKNLKNLSLLANR